MILDYKKIQLIMADMELGTVDFMKLTNITPDTLTRIRQGRELMPKTAGRIAKALKVPVVTIIKEYA